MRPKTVAILGNASRTRAFAPFDDPEIDIWPLSIHALRAPRVTAVIEVHEDVMDARRWDAYPDTPAYRAWLQETTVPIYMHNIHPSIPTSISYPRHQIAARFCRHLWVGEKELQKLFGGSASYSLALALHLGYRRVEFYGVELAKEQYRDERDMFFLWMGKATALGVDVRFHERSRLVRELLYPRSP
jgi:hypothetical protein